MLYRRCLIVIVIVSIIVATYGNESAHSHSYEKPLTGNQIAKSADALFGREVKSLNWEAVVTEKSGRKTFILSDLREIKLPPSEAFGEGNNYCFYSEIKSGRKITFPDGVKEVSIYWIRYDASDVYSDVSYIVYDHDVDADWDEALVLPVNRRTREYDSVVLKLSGTRTTARDVENKYLEYTLAPVFNN